MTAGAVTSTTSVIVLDRPDQLEPHLDAWESLARTAVEPNVFQEPWQLLPAWRAFGAGLPLRAVLIYGPDPAKPDAPPLLYGLFLLERAWTVLGVPVPALRTWTHLQSFLGTPLVRAATASACFDALFDWLARDRRGAPVLQLTEHGSDGPFERHLTESLTRRGLATYVALDYRRAILRNGADVDAMADAMSTGNRKELRRQRRRLGETGRLELRALDERGDLTTWTNQFLELEAAGWKGKDGSALGSNSVRRAFFETITRGAHERGRLMFLGLFLDERPIAMKCNFLAPPASFSFKIAFDEELSRFSPGVQLELDNVAAVHARPDIEWMDSCAQQGHFMIERIWSLRREIRTTLISTGRAPGALVLSALPMMRSLYRKTRPVRDLFAARAKK